MILDVRSVLVDNVSEPVIEKNCHFCFSSGVGNNAESCTAFQICTWIAFLLSRFFVWLLTKDFQLHGFISGPSASQIICLNPWFFGQLMVFRAHSTCFSLWTLILRETVSLAISLSLESSVPCSELFGWNSELRPCQKSSCLQNVGF